MELHKNPKNTHGKVIKDDREMKTTNILSIFVLPYHVSLYNLCNLWIMGG